MAKWSLLLILAGALLAHPAVALADASPKVTPPIPRLLLPATGYWYDAERSGTGFALERRDSTLGVVFYHFSDVAGQQSRVADWHLASGPLQGDTFEAPLFHFAGGSCLGCDPFVAAEAHQSDLTVRLVFASAREATLQVGDGEPRRVVAMAYGVPYESALATPADLPLPDLRGRWVVEARGVGAHGLITLEQRITGDAGVEYRGTSSGMGAPNSSMVCTPEGCSLWLDALPELSPAPYFVGHFHLGDITEERMTGAEGSSFHVLAFRVQAAEVQP